MAYSHTQSGWPMRIAFFAAALGLLVAAAFEPLTDAVTRAVLLGGAALAVLLGLAWSRLTVRLDRDRLVWYFGPGWPRFKLPLHEIATAEVTRTKFWQGWGVHRTRHGWLYNIAGYDAVRITRRDGKQLMIGSDEPRKLKAALERAAGRSARAG
jgi:hypothetical protein